MDIANAGMSKVKDVLNKAAVAETIIWIVLGVVVAILFFVTNNHGDHGIWMIAGIVILIGVISGITLYFGTTRNENAIYKVWFVETGVLLLVLVLGVIFGGIGLGMNHSWDAWTFVICFIVVIPIKIYFFYLVSKFYKWNNRAGVVNAVASAFS